VVPMRVFLSYSDSAADLARNLAAQLSELGIEASDPGEQVLPGDNWALKIGYALQKPRAMIVLLSPDSTKGCAGRLHMPSATGTTKEESSLS